MVERRIRQARFPSRRPAVEQLRLQGHRIAQQDAGSGSWRDANTSSVVGISSPRRQQRNRQDPGIALAHLPELAACGKQGLLTSDFLSRAAALAVSLELMEARDASRSASLATCRSNWSKYRGLLIIDELGFVPLSKTVRRAAVRSLHASATSGARSWCKTSNLPFDDPLDGRYSARNAVTGSFAGPHSSPRPSVHILEMNGRDVYRLGNQQFQKRHDQLPKNTCLTAGVNG